MPLPKRVSIRLDNNEIMALVTSASEYVEQSGDYLGDANVRALEAALDTGLSDFAMVKGLDMEPALIDRAQTYFHLQLAVRQLQDDFDRLIGR